MRDRSGINLEDVWKYKDEYDAAVAGGYTQIFDMPNNIPPTVTYQALDNKIKRAKDRIYCDLGFNFGATAVSTQHFPKVYKKVFGLKVYMNQTTGPLLVDKGADQEIIFKSWPSPLPIMVHAQGETVEIAIKLATKFLLSSDNKLRTGWDVLSA